MNQNLKKAGHEFFAHHPHIGEYAVPTHKTGSSSNHDFLIPISVKELKEAHYRIVAESKGREQGRRLFRINQPGICAYLFGTSPTILTLAYENALICSFARHLCAALEKRYRFVPVLKQSHLWVTEARAKTLLSNPTNVKRIRKLGIVRFAEEGILGVHYYAGIKIVPDAKTVLLKVLTLLLCFSGAIKPSPNPHEAKTFPV